jgi:PBP1b-binding outer membrane lipoprotein LpoB
MKKLTGILIVGVASVVLFSGCVPITYTKTVTVTKDAQGNITGTVVTESITEPHQEMKRIQPVSENIQLDNIK